MTDPFVHPALFYRDADEYLFGTVPFVLEGIVEDEPVAVAVPSPNVELLKDALGSYAERVRFLDMSVVGRNPGRIIPGVLRAFADAHPDRHVRIIGEPVWAGRTDDEYLACMQHEALINRAFSGREVTILCLYDVVGLSQEVLADAEATHPLVVDTYGPRPSERYGPDHMWARYNRALPAPPEHAVTTSIAAGSVAKVRAFAAEHAGRLGLDPTRMDDLLLAVTELVTNSIKHGRSTSTLHLWADGDALVCQVSDTGYITDPLAGRIPARPDQSGGRGLLVVNHLADLVRVHTSPDGTTIQVRFERSHAHNQLET